MAPPVGRLFTPFASTARSYVKGRRAKQKGSSYSKPKPPPIRSAPTFGQSPLIDHHLTTTTTTTSNVTEIMKKETTKPPQPPPVYKSQVSKKPAFKLTRPEPTTTTVTKPSFYQSTTQWPSNQSTKILPSGGGAGGDSSVKPKVLQSASDQSQNKPKQDFFESTSSKHFIPPFHSTTVPSTKHSFRPTIMESGAGSLYHHQPLNHPQRSHPLTTTTITEKSPPLEKADFSPPPSRQQSVIAAFEQPISNVTNDGFKDQPRFCPKPSSSATPQQLPKPTEERTETRVISTATTTAPASTSSATPRTNLQSTGSLLLTPSTTTATSHRRLNNLPVVVPPPLPPPLPPKKPPVVPLIEPPRCMQASPLAAYSGSSTLARLQASMNPYEPQEKAVQVLLSPPLDVVYETMPPPRRPHLGIADDEVSLRDLVLQFQHTQERIGEYEGLPEIPRIVGHNKKPMKIPRNLELDSFSGYLVPSETAHPFFRPRRHNPFCVQC
eukprot:Protomagalhaensia_sp_Gyna_25__3504@NODE_314_length_3915_cov_19_393189_g245_i0_p2_GENE_NODE_314_length_3915_cov_19_393189_g245_i0NODE_314_length_3915_cov_19_393189_g245_i0_p2_ORF_typecomplete_len494_score113_72_NODE_314_length_3915_cov_19_393189_g245_i0521533